MIKYYFLFFLTSPFMIFGQPSISPDLDLGIKTVEKKVELIKQEMQNHESFKKNDYLFNEKEISNSEILGNDIILKTEGQLKSMYNCKEIIKLIKKLNQQKLINENKLELLIAVRESITILKKTCEKIISSGLDQTKTAENYYWLINNKLSPLIGQYNRVLVIDQKNIETTSNTLQKKLNISSKLFENISNFMTHWSENQSNKVDDLMQKQDSLILERNRCEKISEEIANIIKIEENFYASLHANREKYLLEVQTFTKQAENKNNSIYKMRFTDCPNNEPYNQCTHINIKRSYNERKEQLRKDRDLLINKAKESQQQVLLFEKKISNWNIDELKNKLPERCSDKHLTQLKYEYDKRKEEIDNIMYELNYYYEKIIK